jgi:TPR repeat protein
VSEPIDFGRLWWIGILLIGLCNAAAAASLDHCRMIGEAERKSQSRSTPQGSDAKALEGLYLLTSGNASGQGVKLLEEADKEGSMHARYRLGALYMTDALFAKDNARAFSYLSRVGGAYETSALILIGAIEAQGRVGFPPDKSRAKMTWDRAVVRLNAESENRSRSSVLKVDDYDYAERRCMDIEILRAFSEEEGIYISGIPARMSIKSRFSPP